MWTVSSWETDQEFFDACVKLALDTPISTHPDKIQTIGSTEVLWKDLEPGLGYVLARGGTVDERAFASWAMREQFKAAGYDHAEFVFSSEIKTADWNEIMAKAQRLRQAGNVQLLRNGANNIVAHVRGDHGRLSV